MVKVIWCRDSTAHCWLFSVLHSKPQLLRTSQGRQSEWPDSGSGDDNITPGRPLQAEHFTAMLRIFGNANVRRWFMFRRYAVWPSSSLQWSIICLPLQTALSCFQCLCQGSVGGRLINWPAFSYFTATAYLDRVLYLCRGTQRSSAWLPLFGFSHKSCIKQNIFVLQHSLVNFLPIGKIFIHEIKISACNFNFSRALQFMGYMPPGHATGWPKERTPPSCAHDAYCENQALYDIDSQ